uniref:Fibronectin type-III domain-containing protein n=1 Tax=Salarias fasciatus TaxID=181472 RepID=A0A672FAN5_SALFA
VSAAQVAWEATGGASSYSVQAVTDQGLTVSCNASGTRCVLSGVRCGQIYTVTVTAQNEVCSDAGTSAPLRLLTGTSPLKAASAKTRTAAVASWSSTRGAATFTLTADVGGTQETLCSTQDSSCDVRGLSCGRSYSPVLTASNDQCSPLSCPVSTAPCVPWDLSTYAQCEGNLGSVSWGPSDGANAYVAVATGLDGHTHHCRTNTTSCSWDDLHCGETYSVAVRAEDEACSSPDNVFPFRAPCDPADVSVLMDCEDRSAAVSWSASQGATGYLVTAVGSHGNSSCATSGLSCDLDGLACGSVYSVQVVAVNDNCSSAPCSLARISAFTQCHNSSILVTWELMEGGEGSTVYTATAEASDHTFLSCSSSAGSCYLQGARCGLRYTVMVAASSDSCSSLRSPFSRSPAEPCPPSDVSVEASCGDGGALVSWTPSLVADSYQVVAAAADGHVHTCHSASSNCSLSGLRCEQNYVVFVTASHENCSSEASHNATLRTGTGPSAAMLYCHSAGPSCTFHGLRCGALYDFSVKVSDGTCNSSSSDPLQTGAGEAASSPQQLFIVTAC